MTNNSEQTKKGYFNALASGSFKTTADGRRLFYPWGALGRGYVIPSDADYERLHRQLKIYTIVSLVLIIGAAVMQVHLATAAIATLLIVFYFVWTRFMLPTLQPTDEKLSMTESMTSQALTHNTATLWLLELASLAFVAIGIGMLVVDPRQWIAALVAIVFFGACSVVFTRMLLIRRRATS